MFGISGGEFIVLLFVAAIVLGPERLPQYAQQLGRLVRQLRRMAQGAQEQVRTELGPEFEDVDWRKLDPRQYDPRRIVREALQDSFDPDDPLGLKEVEDDVRGTLDDARRPVRGGREADAPTRSTAERRPAGPGRPAAQDDVPFDPDAT